MTSNQALPGPCARASEAAESAAWQTPPVPTRRHFGVLTCCLALGHADAVLGWYFGYSPTPSFVALQGADHGRSEAVACQYRGADLEEGCLIRRAQQGPPDERKATIDCANVLPLKRQAPLLQLSRSSVYYLPRPVPPARPAIMHRIGALHLEHPSAGSRMLRDLLRAEGITIGRLGVATRPERPKDGLLIA